MNILYSLGIRLYYLAVLLFSIFHNKAAKWIEGRKNVFQTLDKTFYKNTKKVIWFHTASMGEFEQARPLIEACKKDYPEAFILVTFFSPSGYEIRKDYPLADHVCYLPLDTLSNAKRFVDTVKPTVALFVKYEFWHNFLTTLSKNNIPTLSVSAIFRQDQVYFKNNRSFFQESLRSFTHFFVQDENSRSLLNSIGINNITVCGDTRFDRVYNIRKSDWSNEKIEQFIDGHKIIVVGSAWQADLDVLEDLLNDLPLNTKVIVAPHEINDKEINTWVQNNAPIACRYNDNNTPSIKESKIMYLDTIGMLSYIYRYATIAYIGGAFGKGLHNTLEACVYNIPVIFGPSYKKYNEAIQLIELELGYSISNKEACTQLIKTLLNRDEKAIQAFEEKASNFTQHNIGATDKIMNYIQKEIQL